MDKRNQIQTEFSVFFKIFFPPIFQELRFLLIFLKLFPTRLMWLVMIIIYRNVHDRFCQANSSRLLLTLHKGALLCCVVALIQTVSTISKHRPPGWPDTHEKPRKVKEAHLPTETSDYGGKTVIWLSWWVIHTHAHTQKVKNNSIQGRWNNTFMSNATHKERH